MIERFFQILDKILSVLCAVLLGGMVLIIFIQVVTRMLKVSLSWTTELSQYMFVWVTFISAYLGARKGKHIGVEIIQNRVAKPLKKVMTSLSWLIASSYFGLVLVYCFKLWSKLGVQLTPILKWPMNIVYSGMMLGLGTMTLYYIYLAITVFTGRSQSVVQEVAE